MPDDAQLSLFSTILGASFGENKILARKPDEGMGLAVARRTVFRKSDEEDWGKVADRVAYGNMSLAYAAGYGDKVEEQRLRNAIASGALLTSGRHLQHGDADQVFSSLELYSNCATVCSSFAMFLLLLHGAGCGRSYDDELMVVDWAQAPDILLYLSPEHIDHYPKSPERFAAEFNLTTEQIPQFVAQEFLTKISDMPAGSILYRVEDSREGWAKAVEIWESLAYAKDNKYPLVLDFSDVRPCGAPIHGMQERPASGPLSVLRAFMNIRNDVVRRAREESMPRWEQAMRVDHHLSVEVQVGGSRRSARMSTKSWCDSDILKFIRIKSDNGLWSSNNSISVDSNFWMAVRDNNERAKGIFDEAVLCAYTNGEPGFINIDKLEDYKTGTGLKRKVDYDGSTFGSKRYKVDAAANMMCHITQLAVKTKYPVTTNPCLAGDTLVTTKEGAFPIKELIGRNVEVWDGRAWCSVDTFRITGQNQCMLKITLTDGSYLRVTPYHTMILGTGERVAAAYLNSGDVLKEAYATSSGLHIVGLVELDGVDEKVYCCTVPSTNSFALANGVLVGNCGEVCLHVTGGFCLVGDSAPLLACPISLEDMIDPFSDRHYNNELIDWDKRAEDALRLQARFLIRCNTMDSFYAYETKRTNRIGVGLTGIHEWAWLRFGISFLDMLDETGKGWRFWQFVKYLSDAAKDEANRYSDELGVNRPVTVTTIKPSGSVSKIPAITEGAHLPARRQYIRWVQFRGSRVKETGEWALGSDPLLAEYEERGYPLKELKTFPGMTIVGFPTEPLITRIGMGDKIVTAVEAAPEQQYQYLRLLEKYWLGEHQSNQISYTLKLYTDQHSLEDFRQIVLDNQPTIRCCAILPSKPEGQCGYEYLPEEEVSKEEFDRIVANIQAHEAGEHIDMETLRCANGVCPL